MRNSSYYPEIAKFGITIQQFVDGSNEITYYDKFFFSLESRDDYIKWLRYVPGYYDHKTFILP